MVSRRLLSTVLGWALLPIALAAQGGPPSPVDTLLVQAGIPNVLAGFSDVVRAQLARTAPSLAGDRLAQANAVLGRHFAGDLLYQAVAVELAGQTTPERMSELYTWVTTGPVAEARRIASAYTPPLPIDQFAAGLAEIPPAEARVLLMLRLSRAQGAGPLFLTLAEAARGAASIAARALDATVPPFASLPPSQVSLALEMHDQQAVLLYLHRYATLSDELIAGVAERYESETGQWFVETLSRVVRDVVLGAAERAADELRVGARRSAGRTRGTLDSPIAARLYQPR